MRESFIERGEIPALYRELQDSGMEIEVSLWEQYGGASWVAEVSDSGALATITSGAGKLLGAAPATRETLSAWQIHSSNEPAISSYIKATTVDQQARYVRSWLLARAMVQKYRTILINPALVPGSPIDAAVEQVRRWGFSDFFKSSPPRNLREFEWFDPQTQVLWRPSDRLVFGLNIGGHDLQFPGGAVPVEATYTLIASAFGLHDGAGAFSDG